MKYLLIPREAGRTSLLVYGKLDSINYTSSVQIVAHDGFVKLDTLNGTDFYRLFSVIGLEPFLGFGVTIFKAEVSTAHFNLIRRRLRGLAAVRIVGQSRLGPADLNLIEIDITKV